MSAVEQTHCTHSQALSPRLPEPAWESRGAPRIGPAAAVLAPLRSLSSRLSRAVGQWSPRQSPVWCLGFSALVPRHQILKGIAKSALATGKNGTKGRAPALSLPLKMPLNKKPKEQRETPLFPDRTKSPCRCATASRWESSGLREGEPT